MSGHTPERLVVTTQDDQVTGCANFESRYGVDYVVLYGDNAKADARRIVQCWNAHDVLVKALEEIRDADTYRDVRQGEPVLKVGICGQKAIAALASTQS